MNSVSVLQSVCLCLSILLFVCPVARGQDPPPACKPGTLADYSELECTVNNLDFRFEKVNFGTPAPKTVQVAPVNNPDGLSFTLPAIPKSDSDLPSPFFITASPSFVYYVKPLNAPVTGVVLQGETAPVNDNSAEHSRDADLLFGLGAEPKVLERLRLILFNQVGSVLVTPLASASYSRPATR